MVGYPNLIATNHGKTKNKGKGKIVLKIPNTKKKGKGSNKRKIRDQALLIYAIEKMKEKKKRNIP